MPCGHFVGGGGGGGGGGGWGGTCAPFAPPPPPPLGPALSKCIAGSVKRSSREYFPFFFFYDVECVTVTI